MYVSENIRIHKEVPDAEATLVNGRLLVDIMEGLTRAVALKDDDLARNVRQLKRRGDHLTSSESCVLVRTAYESVAGSF